MKRGHCLSSLLVGLGVACHASTREESAFTSPNPERVYAYNYDVRDLVVFDPTVHHLRLSGDAVEPPTNRPLQVTSELLETRIIEMANALSSWNDGCDIGCDDLYLIVIGTEEIHAHVATFLSGARTIDDWSATRKEAASTAR